MQILCKWINRQSSCARPRSKWFNNSEKKVKKYGTKAGIEGPKLEERTLVTVLEDVVTTAGSVIKAIKKLRENNYVVEEVLSIVDRQEGGCEALKEENVKLKSLYTIQDFV